MCQIGDIGNFSYEKQKDGTFIYKAKDPSQPIPTIQGVKDQPQFKVINSMENEFKKSGSKMIENTGIDILKFLKNGRPHKTAPSTDPR